MQVTRITNKDGDGVALLLQGEEAKAGMVQLEPFEAVALAHALLGAVVEGVQALARQAAMTEMGAAPSTVTEAEHRRATERLRREADLARAVLGEISR